MTVCPKCNGRGTVGYFHIDHFVDIECDRCNGSGEVSEVEMTNEEWLRSATTEQLADLMSRMVGCSNCPIPKDGRSCMGTYSGCWHEIIKWLKQPHTVKE